MDEWDSEFETIVNRFVEIFKVLEGIPVFKTNTAQYWLTAQRSVFLKTDPAFYIFKAQVHLVEADEDEDFTYGAFSAALAHYHMTDLEHEWLLTKEFGHVYSLRHTDYALTNDDDEG